MKVDVQRLREDLAKFPLPWKLDESFTDFGGRYVGVESSAPSVFEDIAGQNGINQDAAELIAAAINALPELLAIAEGAEADRADARRYRWLQQNANPGFSQSGRPWAVLCASMDARTWVQLDAAIDAALAGAVTQGEGRGRP